MPYGLYRVEYLRQFVSEAEERFTQWTGNPVKVYRNLRPERNGSTSTRLNLDAVAAGLLMNPPVIVPPIPVDPDLPLEPPTHEPVPSNASALARWKYTSQTASDFTLATKELKDRIKLNLPSDIYDTLVPQGGPTGWAAITPGDVFNYVEKGYLFEG